MSSSFRGSWAAEHSQWSAKLTHWFDSIAQIPINILLWGPGERSPDYTKRTSIRDHLLAQNHNNDVAMSEDIMRGYRFKNRHPFVKMHPYVAENIHWHLADVVLIVIPPNPRSTGSRTEAAIFGFSKEFLAKVYAFLPKLPGESRRSASFLDQAFALFPAEQKREYTLKQYADCNRIRRISAEIVERIRLQKGLDILET